MGVKGQPDQRHAMGESSFFFFLRNVFFLRQVIFLGFRLFTDYECFRKYYSSNVKKNRNKHNAELQQKPPPSNKYMDMAIMINPRFIFFWR